MIDGIISFLDLEGLGIKEPGLALDQGDFAGFGQLSQSARELCDDTIFPSAQFFNIHGGGGKSYADVFGVCGFADDLRRMQKRLGRDASAVQAHASEPVAGVDERDRKAEVGGPECGGVAAGAGADDNKLG